MAMWQSNTHSIWNLCIDWIGQPVTEWIQKFCPYSHGFCKPLLPSAIHMIPVSFVGLLHAIDACFCLYPLHIWLHIELIWNAAYARKWSWYGGLFSKAEWNSYVKFNFSAIQKWQRLLCEQRIIPTQKTNSLYVIWLAPEIIYCFISPEFMKSISWFSIRTVTRW